MVDLSCYVKRSTVAKMLGLSRQRVAQLDHLLKPEHTLDGVKLYRVERVEEVAGMRDAAAGWRGERQAMVRLLLAEHSR